MTLLAECDTAPLATDVFGHSWKGRRAAVVGLGRSGQAAARLLCRAGCRVWATDLHDTPELRRVRDGLEAHGVEAVELGGHSRRLIEQAELLVVSPGVPDAGPIHWAEEERLPILSEIELAFHFCPAPIVAVTGTNGKSTAVTLIAAVLAAAGRPAIACGNLGIPFSSVVERLTSVDMAIVEVSSFQLLRCEQFRPRVGVLLNIGTNHLDRHQSADTYRSTKARLFQRQTPEDWAILNARDPQLVALGERVAAQRVWFGENHTNAPRFRLVDETRRALTDGMQAVLQVGRVFEIPDPLTWQVIRTFRGLEHRLEHVATVGGVHFVNDSKSTTPESLLYALAHTRGPLVPIIGGRDKGLDFSALVEALRDPRVKGVVLIGESRLRLDALLNGAPVTRGCETLDEAVRASAALAGAGATVLFSPACASFDMFRDFEHRGRTFKAIVHELKAG